MRGFCLRSQPSLAGAAFLQCWPFSHYILCFSMGVERKPRSGCTYTRKWPLKDVVFCLCGFLFLLFSGPQSWGVLPDPNLGIDFPPFSGVDLNIPTS